MERFPTRDGTADGQIIWYNYYGKAAGTEAGRIHMPANIVKILPDGTTNFVWIKREQWGNASNTISTYSVGSQIFQRTNIHEYATNALDVVREIFKDGNGEIVLAQFAYNSYHQVTSTTNAIGEVTSFT